MKTNRLFVLTIAAMFLITAPALAKTPKGAANTPVYYLSLGTSLAAGVQADPVTGESVISEVSYPGIIAEALGEDGISKLRHVNLGCPGENSDSIVNGGKCEYTHGSQLDEALHFLHAHGRFTGLITIDLGANDVLPCVTGTDIDLQCFTDNVAALADNLALVLTRLRTAAGPDVPIVAMNYYNPLLVYWFQDPLIAQATVGLQQAVNATLASVYGAFAVPVADVAGAFMSYDLVTDDNFNAVPDSVERLCAWTWMCTYQNIHANDVGYGVIAAEFGNVMPALYISTPPRKRR